jgi:hypothetical protein
MSDGEHDDVHGDFHDPEVAVFGKSAALYRPRECVFCSESSRELKTLSAMVYHLNSTHNLQIQNIGSIVPFISDYLRAYALEIDICGNAATALVLGANECDLERRERMRREFLVRFNLRPFYKHTHTHTHTRFRHSPVCLSSNNWNAAETV